MPRALSILFVLAAVAAGLAAPTPAGAAVVNGRIVFAADRNQIFQIARMNADGSHRTFLTTDPVAKFDPQWSPDGSRIAFDRAGRSESLRTMAADGSDVRVVVHLSSIAGFLFIQGLSWSPDGSKLAFCAFRTRTGDSKLFTVDADGSMLTRLSGRDDDDVQPAWSPDGSTIAVESYPGRQGVRGDLVLVDAITGARTPLITAGSTGDPDWSPDGITIAFTKTIAGQPDVFTVPSTGGALTRLTDTPGRLEFDPAWSPDGASILFSRIGQVGAADLWTMSSADGSGVTRLTDTPTRDEIQPDQRAGG
jgi:TolB protein